MALRLASRVFQINSTSFKGLKKKILMPVVADPGCSLILRFHTHLRFGKFAYCKKITFYFKHQEDRKELCPVSFFAAYTCTSNRLRRSYSGIVPVSIGNYVSKHIPYNLVTVCYRFET